ncbi:MAG: metallophosphoesterase [Luteolibacter sp.]|jgi:hypothetical protein|nr:metallophosphoesterase [Luteolibacter sp.]
MTQAFRYQSKRQKRICWMTDLHLDQADSNSTSQLLKKLEGEEYDMALITGDVASSQHLSEHLTMLAKACGSRPIYITLGNHDFYGSSITGTRQLIEKVCRQVPNLHHLSNGGAVDLGNRTILVGGDGWADGQWRGRRTKDINSPDHYSIRDFRGLNKWERLRKMRALGQASAVSIINRLRPALRFNRHIYVASHIPAFRTSALFDGKPCDANHQPHFVHAQLGAILIWSAKSNPSTRFTSLAGHTHSECKDVVLHNLTSIVGGHRKHRPDIQGILAA